MRTGVAAGAVAALALLACNTLERTPAAPSLSVTNPTPGALSVCKVGPAGTTATFSITHTGTGTLPLGGSFTIPSTDACAYGQNEVWLPGAAGDPLDTVTVTETAATPGLTLVRIVTSAPSGLNPYQEFTPPPSSITVFMDGVNAFSVGFKNADTLTVCTDQTAMNYGGALPCQYPSPCPAGSFTYSLLSNGDLFITYDQFPAPNDNSYGVNAVGWPNGHKFNDLVGSDHAGFQLTDGSGTVRLSFNVDYISANTGAPSGYASLGVTGGDGKMIVGTSSGISATSSLANNLNNINIPGLFDAAHVQQFGSVNLLLNSPPTDPTHTTYVISDPLLTGWDFHDTYFVTISAAKLASIGYDPGSWTVAPNPDQLHNSPAKPCPTSSSSILGVTKTEVKDKQVKVTILNSGTSDAFLTELALTWPPVTNGKLMQVKRDGDVIYDNPDISGGSALLTLAQLISDQNKRKWEKGHSHVLAFIFEKNADPDLTHYTGTATFGSFVLPILP